QIAVRDTGGEGGGQVVVAGQRVVGIPVCTEPIWCGAVQITAVRGRSTERGHKLMTMRRACGRAGAIALAAGAVFAAATVPASAQQRRSLIVQSTTSVRDSGLLDQLITPEFKRRYPQYDLKFVAVGTGQAITNARAGQGDVLIGHSPPLEQQFLRDGLSAEPIGRTVMWNDFVIVGPKSDPAGVMGKA